MASSERVLIGRRVRPIDAWPVGAVWAAPGVIEAAPIVETVDPAALEAARATELQLLEARRVADGLGHAEGLARGQQELAGAIAAARTLASTLETAVPADVEMVARTVAELAVLVARRILDGELRNDPTVLVAAIEAGLRQAAGVSVITVELHPTTVGPVEAAWGARHGTRHRGIAWSFTADPTLPVDGCRLRTEHGLVEAGLDAQLAQVAAALEAAVPGYVGSAVKPAEAPDAATAGKAPAAAPASGAPAAAPASKAPREPEAAS